MRVPRMAIVIGLIDDNLVSAAMEYKPASNKSRKTWYRYAIAVACICIVIAIVPIVASQSQYSADDPNWGKTHYETDICSDIEALCGNELLLDKMTFSEDCYTHYCLTIVEGGSFYNEQDWKSLMIEVNYGNSIVDNNSENLLCYISFDGSTEDIYITDFLEDAFSMEINGYYVVYNEMNVVEAESKGINFDSDLNYNGWAMFVYNGYSYYIATQSDNSDFLESTLEQLLE